MSPKGLPVEGLVPDNMGVARPIEMGAREKKVGSLSYNHEGLSKVCLFLLLSLLPVHLERAVCITAKMGCATIRQKQQGQVTLDRHL